MQKYIGKIVQLIYLDSKHNVSIRNVKVLVAGDTRFMAYCYQAKSVRTFNISIEWNKERNQFRIPFN